MDESLIAARSVDKLFELLDLDCSKQSKEFRELVTYAILRRFSFAWLALFGYMSEKLNVFDDEEEDDEDDNPFIEVIEVCVKRNIVSVEEAAVYIDIATTYLFIGCYLPGTIIRYDELLEEIKSKVPFMKLLIQRLDSVE